MNKKVGKPVFFIVLCIILLFTYTTVFGVDSYKGDIKTTYIHGLDDIRLGIDIQGGVDVTFEPEDDVDATEEQMDAAMEVIKLRLTTLGINDSETYVDYNNSRIIVRFPWQSDESDFDPSAAVDELGQMSELTFRYGSDATGDVILTGSSVDTATPGYDQQNSQWVVQLHLNDSGKDAFASATAQQAANGGSISIWMDDVCVSTATVNETISDGNAVISGNFTAESAKELADQITSGALPFSLTATSTKTLSPTLGSGALRAMILSGLIALGFICIYMLFLYRIPGLIAVIGLLGQAAGMLAAVSGWFGFQPSSTLTIPGIAGIILSIGMGVDCNIITAERIREELARGKNVETALKAGYKNAFSAILDGNLTLAIVAIILMGAFGTNTNPITKFLDATIFFAFGATTEGFIYSFGFTLVAGVVLNFIMGVLAARLMSMSLARFKAFQKPSLFGYVEKKYKPAKTYRFSETKKIFFITSICLVVLSICTTFLGTEIAIDFKGGTIVSYSFTVEEVAALGRYAYSAGFLSGRGREDKDAVEAALQLTGMAEQRHQSVLTLSGGELQRTFLAQVFAQDPRLLLLDEPTNHLDLVYQKQVFGLIREWLKTPGRAVVSVVHDLSLARAYGTQALLMDHGRAVAQGSVDEALSPEHLDPVYHMDVYAWMRHMLEQWKEMPR